MSEYMRKKSFYPKSHGKFRLSCPVFDKKNLKEVLFLSGRKGEGGFIHDVRTTKKCEADWGAK